MIAQAKEREKENSHRGIPKTFQLNMNCAMLAKEYSWQVRDVRPSRARQEKNNRPIRASTTPNYPHHLPMMMKKTIS